MPHKFKPFIVSYLKDKVSSWESIGDILRIRLKDDLIDYFDFNVKPIGFGLGEHEAVFLAYKTIFTKQEMNKNLRRLYQILKGMEFEVERKGIIRRSYNVKPFSGLKKLMGRIPLLKYNDLIANMFMKGGGLKLLNDLRFEDFWVALYSGEAPLLKGFNYFDALVDYYYHPQEITWMVYISKLCEVAMISDIDTFKILDILRYILKLTLDISFSEYKKLKTMNVTF